MKVEYIDHMGSDLRVVNAARVSFNKESPELSDKDKKLIHYLAKHRHWTPFAHCQVTLRVTVPIFLANQLKRHQIGLAVNEVSRRYVDDEPEFFAPEAWRKRPEKSIKQGSSDEIVETMDGIPIGNTYQRVVNECRSLYTSLIAAEVAPELARMVLPQSMYTSWYWTGSLAAYARICEQRLDSHAQKEAQLVAQRISEICGRLFPTSWEALLESYEATE